MEGVRIFTPLDHLLICINPRWLPNIYEVSYLCSQKSDLCDLKFDVGVMGHQEYVKMYHNFSGIRFQCKTYKMAADLPKVIKFLL